MKCVDLHSHIIPYIDDGAKNAKVSIELLKETYRQDITEIVATPHFYGSEKDIDIFVNKRAAMLEILQDRIAKENISVPNIRTGAEVMLKIGLSDYTNLCALCIENTDYILLEMPYSEWYDNLFAEIDKIINKCNLIPIIAHVERYVNIHADYENYNKLLALGVVLQFNAASFINLFSKKKVKELINTSKDRPIVLGSDCHDVRFRNTYLKKACRYIKRHYGKDFLNNIYKNSETILKNNRF